MQSVTSLEDLAAVMIVAGIVAVFFHYFKQPVVLDYIISRGDHRSPHTAVPSGERRRVDRNIGVTSSMPFIFIRPSPARLGEIEMLLTGIGGLGM